MIRKYFDEPVKEDSKRRKSSLLFQPYLSVLDNYSNLTSIANSLEVLNLNGANCLYDSQEERSERDLERCKVQCMLNSQGACDFVIELFTSNISNTTFKENLLLAIALLEGGNPQIQKAIYNLFTKENDSEKFFATFHERIENAQKEIKNLNNFVCKDLHESMFFQNIF